MSSIISRSLSRSQHIFLGHDLVSRLLQKLESVLIRCM